MIWENLEEQLVEILRKIGKRLENFFEKLEI